MEDITPRSISRLELSTSSPQETKTLGEALGRLLTAGSVVALEGPLGAGKTTLIQGIGRGLGVKDPITSPTFTLAATYPGKILILYHLDLYRISDEREFIYAGLEDLVWGDGVCVIEWADKVAGLLPRELLWITIEFGPGQERNIKIQARGEKYAQRLQDLKEWQLQSMPGGA